MLVPLRWLTPPGRVRLRYKEYRFVRPARPIMNRVEFNQLKDMTEDKYRFRPGIDVKRA
ncbi:MAG: hypothetical protein P4M11_07120 [Candidatus Pacebacteria bacterium]|nr:hypothetical protein [Candidatus Paceibacterota bacterium]